MRHNERPIRTSSLTSRLDACPFTPVFTCDGITHVNSSCFPLQDCVTIEGPDTVVLKAPRSSQSNRQSDKPVPQTAQRFTFTQVPVTSPVLTCLCLSRLFQVVVVALKRAFHVVLLRCSVRRPGRGRCSRVLFVVWFKMFCREETVWCSPTASPTLGKPSPSWVRRTPCLSESLSSAFLSLTHSPSFPILLSGPDHDSGLLPRSLSVIFNSIEGRLYGRGDLKPQRCRDFSRLTPDQQAAENSSKKNLLRLLKEVRREEGHAPSVAVLCAELCVCCFCRATGVRCLEGQLSWKVGAFITCILSHL